MSNFLAIGETEFGGTLQPAAFIKGEIQSRSNAADIRILVRKKTLKIFWNLLGADEMQILQESIKNIKQSEIRYCTLGESEQIRAVCRTFSYTPFMDGNQTKWRDICLELVEA